jgi:hypothetical protein
MLGSVAAGAGLRAEGGRPVRHFLASLASVIVLAACDHQAYRTAPLPTDAKPGQTPTAEEIIGKTCAKNPGDVSIEAYREQDPSALFYSVRVLAAIDCPDEHWAYKACADVAGWNPTGAYITHKTLWREVSTHTQLEEMGTFLRCFTHTNPPALQ